MKIVVIGGTGLIGSKLVALLRQRGQEMLAASPDTGVDTLTGKGLSEALSGAQVVVDVANSPSFEDTAVMKFFQTSGFHEFVTLALSAKHDKRKVVADPHARYFGAELGEESLIPGSTARIGQTRYEAWVSRSGAPR